MGNCGVTQIEEKRWGLRRAVEQNNLVKVREILKPLNYENKIDMNTGLCLFGNDKAKHDVKKNCVKLKRGVIKKLCESQTKSLNKPDCCGRSVLHYALDHYGIFWKASPLVVSK